VDRPNWNSVLEDGKLIDITEFFSGVETERLILRNICEDDTDFIFHHFSDPWITQYLMDEPPVENLDEAKAIVEYYLNPEMKNHNRWIILRKKDQRPVGTCGFHKWDKAHLHAEIGYDLAADCWGQGFMSEALRAVISGAFTRMKLNRIDAMVYIGNSRSIKLLQKLGFEQEGLLREYFYLNNTFFDHLFFGLLHYDWCH